MDAEAQYSSGVVSGKSGGARGKDAQLNLGDLSFCEDTPSKVTTLSTWQHAEMERQKSAEAVLAMGGPS